MICRVTRRKSRAVTMTQFHRSNLGECYVKSARSVTCFNVLLHSVRSYGYIHLFVGSLFWISSFILVCFDWIHLGFSVHKYVFTVLNSLKCRRRLQRRPTTDLQYRSTTSLSWMRLLRFRRSKYCIPVWLIHNSWAQTPNPTSSRFFKVFGISSFIPYITYRRWHQFCAPLLIMDSKKNWWLSRHSAGFIGNGLRCTTRRYTSVFSLITETIISQLIGFHHGGLVWDLIFRTQLWRTRRIRLLDIFSMIRG